MEVCATLAPSSARVRLGRLRTWLENAQDEAIASLSLLPGLWLWLYLWPVGKGIYRLTAWPGPVGRHRIARGLTGDPVAAGSRSGAITQRNDQRPSCAQIAVRSSNRRWSSR